MAVTVSDFSGVVFFDFAGGVSAGLVSARDFFGVASGVGVDSGEAFAVRLGVGVGELALPLAVRLGAGVESAAGAGVAGSVAAVFDAVLLVEVDAVALGAGVAPGDFSAMVFFDLGVADGVSLGLLLAVDFFAGGSVTTRGVAETVAGVVLGFGAGLAAAGGSMGRRSEVRLTAKRFGGAGVLAAGVGAGVALAVGAAGAVAERDFSHCRRLAASSAVEEGAGEVCPHRGSLWSRAATSTRVGMRRRPRSRNFITGVAPP